MLHNDPVPPPTCEEQLTSAFLRGWSKLPTELKLLVLEEILVHPDGISIDSAHFVQDPEYEHLRYLSQEPLVTFIERLQRQNDIKRRRNRYKPEDWDHWNSNFMRREIQVTYIARLTQCLAMGEQFAPIVYDAFYRGNVFVLSMKDGDRLEALGESIIKRSLWLPPLRFRGMIRRLHVDIGCPTNYYALLAQLAQAMPQFKSMQYITIRCRWNSVRFGHFGDVLNYVFVRERKIGLVHFECNGALTFDEVDGTWVERRCTVEQQRMYREEVACRMRKLILFNSRETHRQRRSSKGS